MTNVHSQTNGQQSQGCSVTPSASKHGAIGLDELSGGSKKRREGGGAGGKDTVTQSSDSSLPDCSTATSVLSQTWGARSPTGGVQGEERAAVSSPTSASGSQTKPKRKPAPSKPGSACSNAPAAPENQPSPSPRTPSTASSAASSALLPSSTPLENLNTNRNNSTALNQTPPPYIPPSPFCSPALSLSPSPAPSTRFRETPILRRAPRAASSASARYQTLPALDAGRSRARRRYSLSETSTEKTHSQQGGGGGGGAPKLGRILRNKRSLSMSGMLLHKDGDSEKAWSESDWILESTV